MNPAPEDARPTRTRIGAYALLVRDGAILLARISGQLPDSAGQWTLPGGGIDFGEHPADAAVREVREETGLIVRVSRVLAIESWCDNGRPDERYQSIQIILAGEIVGGALTHERDGSTDLCEWVPLTETAKYPLVDLARRGVALAAEM